jgi:hypothetical protein
MKAQVAESKSLMREEIKVQLDDFLTKFMRLQTSTPPPQFVPVESATSNMAQVINQGPCLGENCPALTIFPSSPAMPTFNLLISPQSLKVA